MALLNHAKKELNAKIVYYGPGLSGKTTNLEWIHKKMEPEKRGKLISLETKTDRTLFFDFLPVQIGEIAGYRMRFNVYTVPGQIFYNETRKMVLKGVDGIVFVADCQKEMASENMESLKNLGENLASIDKSLDEIPLVLQYNKMDLPNTLTVEEMNRLLNEDGNPFFEAIAVQGEGVLTTLARITRMVAEHLKNSLFQEKQGEGSSRPSPTPVFSVAPTLGGLGKDAGLRGGSAGRISQAACASPVAQRAELLVGKGGAASTAQGGDPQTPGGEGGRGSGKVEIPLHDLADNESSSESTDLRTNCLHGLPKAANPTTVAGAQTEPSLLPCAGRHGPSGGSRGGMTEGAWTEAERPISGFPGNEQVSGRAQADWLDPSVVRLPCPEKAGGHLVSGQFSIQMEPPQGQNGHEIQIPLRLRHTSTGEQVSFRLRIQIEPAE